MEERFNIDGREVLIINNTGQQFPRLVKVILLICKTEQMAWHFPKLMFELRLDLSQSQVDMERILAGEMIISISVQKYRDEAGFEQTLIRTVNHELTHLYQEYKTHMFHLQYGLRNRLINALNKVVTVTELVYPALTRVVLFNLVRKLFTEGVAEYYGELKSNKLIYSEEAFKKLYSETHSDVIKSKNLLLDWSILLGNKKFILTKTDQIDGIYDKIKSILETLAYPTGYHMVYTILFVDHKTTFEDILHFQPFEFIRKYEECMEIKSLQPVVSVTSGKGVLDYKTMLAQLTAAAKEVQKKSS